MRRRAVAAAFVLVLAAAAPARAAWFAAEPVDGPGAIDAVGGVSLSADGSGGLAYVKGGAGYLSRFAGGTWQPPVRLPGSAVTDIKLVAWGDSLAVVWIAGGRVLAAQARAGALSAPVALTAGGGASGLDVATGAEGGAYAVWSAAGDVRAAKTSGPG